MNIPIHISGLAAQEATHIMQHKNIPAGYALRIGVRGGGCVGHSFFLGFDTAKDGDDTYELDGLPVVIEKRHTMYLLGMHLDFEDGATARGFVFLNEAEWQERVES